MFFKFNIPALVLAILCCFLVGCASKPSKEERYNNLSAQEIYDMGKTKTLKKRYAQAIEDFEAIDARYPFGEYADKALLATLYCYLMNQDYPSALATADRFIRLNPRHPNVDYAYYLRGLVHFNESLGPVSKYLPMERAERDTTAATKSFTDFHTLTVQFPNSPYVPDAKQRLIYLRNILADNEFHAANFYLAKKEYVAAATRANTIIKHFDQSPVVVDALAILIQAYRHLEMTQLAEDAYRVLQLNYPESPYVESLKG
ncbi:MAG TPA: outer membrane protein assembly factor BamD [Gammaproteobacteria bacterium]|nr:outer membrane protein assembly factor BamD [Gammaproteobacteria bacterium]